MCLWNMIILLYFVSALHVALSENKLRINNDTILYDRESKENETQARANCVERNAMFANINDVAVLQRMHFEHNDTFWVDSMNMILCNGIRLNITVQNDSCQAIKIYNGSMELFAMPCNKTAGYLCKISFTNASDGGESSNSCCSKYCQKNCSVPDSSNTLSTPATQSTTQKRTRKTTTKPTTEFISTNATGSTDVACGVGWTNDATIFLVLFIIALLFFIALAIKHFFLIRLLKHHNDMRGHSHKNIVVKQRKESVTTDIESTASYENIHDAPAFNGYENVKQGNVANLQANNDAYEPVDHDEMRDGYITPATLPNRCDKRKSFEIISTEDGYVDMEIGKMKKIAIKPNLKSNVYVPTNLKKMQIGSPKDVFSDADSNAKSVSNHKFKTLAAVSQLQQNSSTNGNETVQSIQPKVALKPKAFSNCALPGLSTNTNTDTQPGMPKTALRPPVKSNLSKPISPNAKTKAITSLSMAKKALKSVKKT